MKTSSTNQDNGKNLGWRDIVRNKYAWISTGVILVIIVAGYFTYDYFSVDAVEASEAPQIQTAVARSGDLTVFATGAGQVILAMEVNLGFEEGGTLAELLVTSWPGCKLTRHPLSELQTGPRQSWRC